MIAYLAWLALFAAIAVGVIFGLGALGLMTSQAEGGVVGLALGSAAVVGAAMMAARP